MFLSARWGALRAPLQGRERRLLILAVLAIALALAGGASRFDEDQQAIVRIVAILVLGLSFWPLDFKPLAERSGLVVAAAAAYLLLVLQLIPLPPGVWASLPGHGPYADIARQTGAVVWRPLSLTPDLTLNSLYALLPATAAAVAALYLDNRQRIWLARGVVAIAFLSAALGLFQVAGAGSELRLYRVTSDDAPVGLLANRNHQAALLSLSLALIGALVGIRRRDVGDRRVGLGGALALAAVLILATLSTGSRMGLLLCTLGILGGLAAYKAAGRKLLPVRPVMKFAVVAGALTIAACIAAAAVQGGAVERLANTNRVSETRAQMVQPLLTTARAFMPYGSGMGSFDSVYRRFEPESLLSTIYMNQAHDEALQLAIEGGAAALALLAGFAVWWLWTVPRAILARASSPGGRALSIAWATGTVILLASSLVDYPLRTPLLSAVFVVACVELGRASRRISEPRPAAQVMTQVQSPA